MVTGKFLSLNARGISNYRKRRTIFTWFRKQKPDVVFLQETHSTQGNKVSWQREWGATLICSHGANNARGVAILIKNNFDCVVEESVIDTNGRYIILKVLLSGEPALLVNIYGPNRDNELVAFYHTVLQTIENKRPRGLSADAIPGLKVNDQLVAYATRFLAVRLKKYVWSHHRALKAKV